MKNVIDQTTPETDNEDQSCSADANSAYMQMRDHARRLEAALIREQDAHEKARCSLWAAEECIGKVREMVTSSRYDGKEKGVRFLGRDVGKVIDQWAEKVINGYEKEDNQ